MVRARLCVRVRACLVCSLRAVPRHLPCVGPSSLAVFCVAGYVLGIGDRHLDNFLVDEHSGQVIHQPPTNVVPLRT